LSICTSAFNQAIEGLPVEPIGASQPVPVATNCPHDERGIMFGNVLVDGVVGEARQGSILVKQ
jgi:hypothetical protein